jgi:hypothetical protein
MNKFTDWLSAFFDGSGVRKPAMPATEESPKIESPDEPYVKFFTKESLIEELRAIKERGWIENTLGNSDGVQGDVLEHLLHIPTNNIPIPDASGWELKTQKKNTSSLISLSHREPEPRDMSIVPNFLLPNYGWPHQKAGTEYPENEMSLRLTMNGLNYMDRGFKIKVNRPEQRVEIEFNSAMVDPRHAQWLESVKEKVGLGPLPIIPYYSFHDLYLTIGRKFYNTFLVRVDTKREGGKQYFLYDEVWVLENVDIDKFLTCIEEGKVKIEFDARTGHNHGTKMRMLFRDIPSVYKKVTRVI